MKKIMFNDKYGLTDAVLQGRKTMTRRLVPIKEAKRLESFFDGDDWDYAKQTCIDDSSTYEIGEVVAVAQSYKDLKLSYIPHIDEPDFKTCTKHAPQWGNPRGMKGWSNKMFVRADLMPYRIKITDIKAEKLQDISDEDCLKEGIIRRDDMINSRMEDVVRYTFENSFVGGVYKTYATPREAFAALIDKVSGKGTWQRNPYVFAYTFELVK